MDKQTEKNIDRELAFNVEIKDVNDNPPTFSKSRYEEDVMENIPEGEYTVAQMTHKSTMSIFSACSH